MDSVTSVPPHPIRRILIRANNWIGDVVMISPAVRAIREHFDKARIAILAKSWVLEALQGNPYYDDLIEYDREGSHRGLLGRGALVAELRRARFDLAVLFQKAFEAAFFAYLAGVPARIGYATDRRALLLTHPLAPPSPGTHHVEQFLGIARALGCRVRDPLPSFHVDPESRARAASILESSGRDDTRPLVALHPGASKPERAWHPERFGDLGARIARRADAQIVLLGGPGEEGLLRRIATALEERRTLLIPGAMRLKEVGAILERCSLFVGNDSGPM